ncbi:MAG: MBL fold metallo-hydrolase [Flavobacteriaceae bacterium]
MKLTFVGAGDAFGSGGRFNTCFHVAAPGTSFLIDCGASSLVALRRYEIDRDAIDTIFITHFHGDHFAGLPFFVLDARFVTARRRPLTIVGPKGVEARFWLVMEALFHGASSKAQAFDLHFREISGGQEMAIGDVRVTASEVVHGDPGGPCLGYRFEVDGRVIAYSGDTEWTDALIALGRGADLMICECYLYDRPVRYHLNLKELEAHLPEMAPKRLILTHMSEDMLARTTVLGHETAADGKVVEI